MQSSKPEFVSEIPAVLLNHMGSDEDLLHAARVSTGSSAQGDPLKNERLINRLMRDKHGSPFEHGSFTFLVKAPLFVWREHHRHRVGFSYNEESGRYKELKPEFYVPARARVQSGKPMDYNYADALGSQTSKMVIALMDIADHAYVRYQEMLAMGIAREVARMCLPVNILSTCYVTCNPRSLMNFLELRLASGAQEEIRMVAEQYDKAFERTYPLTHNAFHENGRVAP